MINHEALVIELSNLANLQLKLNKLGGPDFDGEIFDEILEIQDNVLSLFGLSSTTENEKLLYFNEIPSQEEILERITSLHNRATIYLQSDTKSDIQILNEAQEFSHEFSAVLPELNIRTHVYTIFVYNEILLKKDDSIENVLNELKIANHPENLDALGRLLFEEDEQVFGELFEMLENNGLIYLDKFIIANFLDDDED